MVYFKDGDTIVYEVKGTRADHVAHLKALALALGALDKDTPEQYDARQTISQLLIDILPGEKQIK